MHQGNVRLVGQSCSTCGYGPVQPRQESSYDRLNKATIIEAVWICPHCGSRFAQGIVESIPDEK